MSINVPLHVFTLRETAKGLGIHIILKSKVVFCKLFYFDTYFHSLSSSEWRVLQGV